MISIDTLSHSCPDLNSYETIAKILAQELPSLTLGSEPLDVVDSLENLSDEMGRMPEIIQDCRLATEAFDELDQVIGHMYALADRAVELPPEAVSERQILHDEFCGYSHIVARLAGANDYDGPQLSLATKPEAMAARKILSYLNEARRSFTKKLADQRRQINDAMDEALDMLVKIVSETEELSHHNRGRLRDILGRLSMVKTDLLSQPEEHRPPSGWLH